ncbi:MAG TPA: E3 binding domain-containing protein, partial [Ferruginibacter sp.]|nr:E3 binding domain-containing protein [Ferruginibacter sp.]HRP50347.1 E3 binding domain-containing protein [Ferruginibacter sp.]
MAIEVKVPTVGESINEVTLVKWLIPDGGYAERDAVIAELESEKATFEVNAEQAGAVKYIAAEGDTLAIGDVICSIDTDAPAPAPQAEAPREKAPAAEPVKEKPAAPAAEPATAVKATPVAAAIIADKKIDTKNIQASGSHGKITKQDVLQALSNPGRPAGALFSREEKTEKMSNLRKT